MVLFTPQQAADRAVHALKGLGQNGTVLAMGEDHYTIAHQVTETLALRDLVEAGIKTILFMEFPHNRFFNIMQDRGYPREDALKLSQYIQSCDSKGHILCKALIGGNADSLRGENFARYQSQIALQAAIYHDVKMVPVDAARVYPDDFCMDYSDPSTNAIAEKLGVRRGSPGEMGPDDMLLRNTHMAEGIKAELAKNGGVGLLTPGGAHCMGVSDKDNGLHLYKDSLAARFEAIGQRAAVLTLKDGLHLPPDYTQPQTAKQIHVSIGTGPKTQIKDMSAGDVEMFLKDNGLDPAIYDPKRYVDSYRAEFDDIVRQAENDLGIQKPDASKSLTSAPVKKESVSGQSGSRGKPPKGAGFNC